MLLRKSTGLNSFPTALEKVPNFLLPDSYPRFGNPDILYLLAVFTGAFLTSMSK